MSNARVIPIFMAEADAPRGPYSGEKYLTQHGHTAIRDGIKGRVARSLQSGKPAWLKGRAPAGPRFEAVRDLVRRHSIATVCKEARCPNIGECWSAGTATLMLLGEVCTRACRFCAVDTGNPNGRVDVDEPGKVAQIVKDLQLAYVVLTAVNRDDLPDGGAQHFADVICAVRGLNPQIGIEALTPDFRGCLPDVDTLVDSGPDVFAQNLETVRRLTHPVRDVRAGYTQTLDVLAHAKRRQPNLLVKTSLMLGLGETETELYETFDDARAAGVDVVTLGQYLQPTGNHLPVQRWVTPEDFARYRDAAMARGFVECVAGPMVRSSYRAERSLRHVRPA